MTVQADEFKKGLQLWASGVTVVTTKTDQNGPQGMTATSFASVSLDPPQVLVCINEQADTGEGIQDCQHFAINILSADQEAVSNEFAGGASQEERFANISWSQGKSGMPVLDESLATLECKISQQIKAGSHWILVGEVLDVVCRTGDPLLYFRSGYRSLNQS